MCIIYLLPLPDSGSVLSHFLTTPNDPSPSFSFNVYSLTIFSPFSFSPNVWILSVYLALQTGVLDGSSIKNANYIFIIQIYES